VAAADKAERAATRAKAHAAVRAAFARGGVARPLLSGELRALPELWRFCNVSSALAPSSEAVALHAHPQTD